MADNLLIQVQPQRPGTRPGQPVPLEVVIENQGFVDQYATQVLDLDTSWYSLPPSVSLFPGETSKPVISLHPPRGTKTGQYPFRVQVTTQGGTVKETVDCVLDVTGDPKPRMVLEPLARTARGAVTYTVILSNVGDADANLTVLARDSEDACRISFPQGDTVNVPASAERRLPMRVAPRRAPWVGAPHTYSLELKAGQPSVRGSYTHQPWLKSWSAIIKPLLVVGALVLLVIVGLWVSSTDFGRLWYMKMQIAVSSGRAHVCQAPAIDRLCPADAFASKPAPDPGCTFEPPFKVYSDKDKVRIGECVSTVDYDGFGNAMQFSTNGVLFWEIGSNTVFFFEQNGGASALVQDKELELKHQTH